MSTVDAWETFQRGSVPVGVRAEVLASWRRSRWTGVDPAIDVPPVGAADDDSPSVRAAAPVRVPPADPPPPQKWPFLRGAPAISLGDQELEPDSFSRVVSGRLDAVHRTIALGHDLLAVRSGSVVTVASMYSYLSGGRRPHAAGPVRQHGEIGSVVAFLSSDAASFVTGAVLPVDGGHLVTGT